jgi:hypothetical protein
MAKKKESVVTKWTKGGDFKDGDVPTYGINKDEHGNAIEVYSSKEDRDLLLKFLIGKKEEGVTIEIKAVKDEGVMGEPRIHFVFPAKPDGAARALYPIITGGIWIKNGSPIPDRIIITLPKE